MQRISDASCVRALILKLNSQSGPHLLFNSEMDLVFQIIDGNIYLVSSFQIKKQRQIAPHFPPPLPYLINTSIDTQQDYY